MPELTLLETIAEFDEATRKTLAEYWIASAEEFVTVARSSNRQFGNGLTALGKILNLEPNQVEALLQAADRVIPPHFSFAIEAELEVGTGAIFEGMEIVEPVSFDVPTEALPPEIWLGTDLPPPHHQGKRNTCVAFAVIAMYQHASGDTTDLSEQFLYWACKERDGIRGDVGTLPDLALRLLAETGVCVESTWPYHPDLNPSNAGQGPPPAGAEEEAQQRRITGFSVLPAKEVRALQAALAQGQTVLFGLPIDEHWTNTYQARTLGRVRKPLPGEGNMGGHAMCAVGYRDDASVPGGGYFIVRNSWGSDWGKENPDGPGYAHVPYRLVFESNLVALVIDGIVQSDQPALGDTKQASSAKPTVGESSTAETEQTAAFDPQSGIDVQAIYAEALVIQQRLNVLVEQLAVLAQRQPPPADPSTQPQGVPESASTDGATSYAAGASPPSGSLILIAEHDSSQRVDLPPNGINGITGQPLVAIDAAAAEHLAHQTPDPPELQRLHQAKQNQGKDHLGVVAGFDVDSIEDCRWAVVVNANDDTAILKAITPLIQHRSAQQGITLPPLEFRDGERCGEWLQRIAPDTHLPWQQRPPVLLYQPGEDWLARHNVSQGPVDPSRGVPFYLMLLGRPGPLTKGDTAFIPFSFQYQLDMFWGVGRLCFNDMSGQHNLAAYEAYAEQVAAFEQAAPMLRKHVVYFGAQHDLDRATALSAQELVTPLAQGVAGQKPVAERFGYTQQLFLASDATRANLEQILRGGDAERAPALLFTATHGIGLPPDDPRLLAQQGALVCQDWTGFGSIKREHWFAAEDVPAQARVLGLIAVCFACYGAGCPHDDQFLFEHNKARPIIAPYPFIAQLPQQLLARGALAVLGHIDRAWNYSFNTPNTPAQSQAFADVIGRILTGKRLGFATDQFNMRQGALATLLADTLESVEFGKRGAPSTLGPIWIARNDARNYALLGDPAVRLPFNS
ncbi:MAG: C1 family peptidase [Chloroflexales bacterium]|nr:C1 family peptidase [Chloroflexales bacterium]